jgi:hypothetical protein
MHAELLSGQWAPIEGRANFGVWATRACSTRKSRQPTTTRWSTRICRLHAAASVGDGRCMAAWEKIPANNSLTSGAWAKAVAVLRSSLACPYLNQLLRKSPLTVNEKAQKSGFSEAMRGLSGQLLSPRRVVAGTHMLKRPAGKLREAAALRRSITCAHGRSGRGGREEWGPTVH